MNFPKDLILMISGVPCVGKTTTAYRLIERVPAFRRVSELDILRTMARAVADDAIAFAPSTETEKVKNHFAPLYLSVSKGGFDAMKEQAAFMRPYIREIVARQQSRKIPTIIEGSCIVPSVYFPENRPLEGFTNHIVFCNLYVSDLNDHLQRRKARCSEREYPDNFPWENRILGVRKENLQLHNDTLSLQKHVPNVFSLDVSGKDVDSVVNEILELIPVQ